MDTTIYITKSMSAKDSENTISISKKFVIEDADVEGDARMIFCMLLGSLPAMTYQHLLAFMLAETKRAEYFEALRDGELVEL